MVMGKKRRNQAIRKDRAAAAAAEPAPTRSGNGRSIALALLGIGGALFVYALVSDSPRDSAQESPTEAARSAAPSPRQFRYFENPEDAHPLPQTLAPSRFTNPGIAASYQIAKEIPEVLAQQPCLCGCDNPSDNHRSLLDCFTDEHAATCMICMKEAVFAKQKTEAGESGEWIRNAILRHEFSDVSIGN